jgi:hypothetical protein
MLPNEEAKASTPSAEDEKPNGSATESQEAPAKAAQNESIFNKIWKKADLNLPTVMLMLKYVP